jgi:hypothetical protein
VIPNAHQRHLGTQFSKCPKNPPLHNSVGRAPRPSMTKPHFPPQKIKFNHRTQTTDHRPQWHRRDVRVPESTSPQNSPPQTPTARPEGHASVKPPAHLAPKEAKIGAHVRWQGHAGDGVWDSHTPQTVPVLPGIALFLLVPRPNPIAGAQLGCWLPLGTKNWNRYAKNRLSVGLPASPRAPSLCLPWLAWVKKNPYTRVCTYSYLDVIFLGQIEPEFYKTK